MEDDCTEEIEKREKKALKILFTDFMQDFYKKNGVKLKDMTEGELKSVLLESLKDEILTCYG